MYHKSLFWILLLLNIYINDLFWLNEETDICNYADDTTPHACDTEIQNLIRRLEHDCLLEIEWFDNVGDAQIWESNDEVLLCITIDKEMKFKGHFSKLSKKVKRKIPAFTRVSRCMTTEKRRVLFKSFVESQFVTVH